MAETLSDRSFEVRARNNYASSIGDEDPALMNRLMEETARLSQDIGDRGMYAWQIANAALGAVFEGRDWDHYYALLRDLADETTLPAERVRVLTFLTVFEAFRGGGLEPLAEIEALVDDDPGQETLFSLHLARCYVAFGRRDHLTAFREARRAWEAETQAKEIPAGLMLRAAARAGDTNLLREAAGHVLDIRSAGALSQSYRHFATGALAVLDGRPGDALDDLLASSEQMSRLKQIVESADLAIDALALLPHEPRLRELAASGRPLLEEVQAAPSLADLDQFLAAGATASAPAVVAGTAEVAAEQP
jgi:hypothetical protein